MSDEVDVLLVLEGTYPFVLGGVSSWVHRVIGQLPELRFGVVHLAPRVGFYGEEPAYDLPDNVAFVREIGLTPSLGRAARIGRRHAPLFASLWRDLERLRHPEVEPTALLRALRERAARLQDAGFGPAEVLASAACRDACVRNYEATAPDESFLDFFWTWRFAYQPLVELLFVDAPSAALVHTVSTGYAGFFGALVAVCADRPLLVTEHGIYTKERRIELYAAEWVRAVDGRGSAGAVPLDDLVIDGVRPFFERFWTAHFEALSRCCYAPAGRIVTLYGDNRAQQIADGAEPERCEIIPNGVDVRALAAAVEERESAAFDRPFTVAFVGRVCPIKDVRTFLAAMRLVVAEVPDCVVRVLGPMAEDAAYAEECRAFCSELGLDGAVHFEGPVDVRRELPAVDVLVLTSISEAQPLVVLEAGGCAVPVVATDVGSCRELLEGRTPEDRAIGHGGFVAPIAAPGAIASHVLDLWADPDLRRRLGRNLQERVRRFYDERQMIARYRALYAEHLTNAEVV